MVGARRVQHRVGYLYFLLRVGCAHGLVSLSVSLLPFGVWSRLVSCLSLSLVSFIASCIACPGVLAEVPSLGASYGSLG